MIQKNIDEFQKALEENQKDALSLVEIIPGEGFKYDKDSGHFKKEVASDLIQKSAVQILKDLNQ